MSSPLPLTLRLHRSIEEVDARAWDALLDDAARPCLAWRFLAALERSGSACPATGWHPRHLTLWRGGKLVAAAPAWLRDDSQGEFVWDLAWAAAAERAGVRYYPKLVLTVPFTPATGTRILVAPGEPRAALEAQLVAGAREYARSERLSGVHVLFPTQGEAERLAGLGFALRLGVQYHWERRGERTLEDWLARFRSKRRTQLRRELRAPAEAGLALCTLRGADALAQVDPDALYGLYATTVDKYGWSPRHLTRDFFRRALTELADMVEVVQATRRADGAWVAGAFNLAGPRVLYGRYWGAHARVRFLHFNVCLYHGVEQALERGLERFEPGAGGEHKLARGFVPRLTYSAHLLFHPGLDRAVRTFLEHEAAAVVASLPRWQEETGLKDGP